MKEHLKFIILFSFLLVSHLQAQTDVNMNKQAFDKYDETIDNYERTGYVRVRKNYKWGIADTSGNEIIPCKYDETTDLIRDNYNNTNFIKVKLKNKWGIIDTLGNEIAACKYDTILGSFFYYDFLIVKLNNKWGYVNQNGLEILPKYDEVEDFQFDGWAKVILNGKRGLLSNSGIEFFPGNFYDDVIDYVNGFAKVKLNGKWGFVNHLGKEIIPCKYDDILNFDKSGFTQIAINNKWAFVNKTGRIITPFKYDIANIKSHCGDGYEFHDGLAAVNIGGKFGKFDPDYWWSGGKWGFIDTTGKEVIPCSYDNVNSDKNGKYDCAPSFSSDGFVRFKKWGKVGCIDVKGNKIISFKYNYIDIFENGKAKVKLNGEEFFIDKNGKRIK